MEKRSVGVLAVAAATEAAAGVILFVFPPVALHLMFGAPSSASVSAIGRLTGLALIALGAACWPSRTGGSSRALVGLLLYSLTVTVYFSYLGLAHEAVGPLLWPAVILHGVLTLVLARVAIS